MQITGELTLLATIDTDGARHALGLLEGATENAAVVQALLGNLVGRGLDVALTTTHRRWLEGAFGRHTPVQRCQIHKARNNGSNSCASICMPRCARLSASSGTRRSSGACRQRGGCLIGCSPTAHRRAIPGIAPPRRHAAALPYRHKRR